MSSNGPHATRAIQIIQSIFHELGPDYAAYWVLPNTVLTLAGARGLCDGVFYHPHKRIRQLWQDELKACRPVLSRHLELLFFEVNTGVSPAFKESYVAFDLLHRAGLQYTLQQTKFLPASQSERLLQPVSTAEAFGEAFISLLGDNPRTKAYDEELLHDIMAGILLGYPDKAISSILDANATHSKMTPARIAHADYYPCPQPIYDYAPALATIPAIKRHEKLWSTILSDFYSSEFHQRLEKNPAFRKKLQAIIKY